MVMGNGDGDDVSVRQLGIVGLIIKTRWSVVLSALSMAKVVAAVGRSSRT